MVAGTTTAVTASPTSITAAGSVTLTATVKSSSGTPSGMVTFTSGGATLGAANLSGGIATLTTTALPVGTDSIVASYAGTATFAASSGSASVTVTPAAPGYTLTSSVSTLTITQGQTGNDTLVLTPTGGFSGTVTFSCTNLPANAACAFAQNPVNLSGTKKVSVGLSIQTNVQVAQLLPATGTTRTPLSPVLPALAFWWPGSLAGLAAFGRKRIRALSPAQMRRFTLCVLLAATGALAMGLRWRQQHGRLIFDDPGWNPKCERRGDLQFGDRRQLAIGGLDRQHRAVAQPQPSPELNIASEDAVPFIRWTISRPPGGPSSPV